MPKAIPSVTAALSSISAHTTSLRSWYKRQNLLTIYNFIIFVTCEVHKEHDDFKVHALLSWWLPIVRASRVDQDFFIFLFIYKLTFCNQQFSTYLHPVSKESHGYRTDCCTSAETLQRSHHLCSLLQRVWFQWKLIQNHGIFKNNIELLTLTI